MSAVVPVRAQRRRLRSPKILFWVAPLVVWIVVLRPLPLPYTNVRFLLAATTGVLAIAALQRRPVVAMQILVGGLAFANIIISAANANGLPVALLRPMGYWKEAMIAAVCVAALRRVAARPRAFDTVDRLAAGYLVLSFAYVLDPGILIGDAPGANLGLFDRIFSWRADVLYIVLFLAARHVRFSADEVVRIIRVLLVSLSIVGVLAVLEFFFTERWRDFLLVDIEYHRYLSDVLGRSPEVVNQLLQRLRNRAAAALPRVGSTQLNPNALAFPLLVGLAFSVEALVQNRVRRVAIIACALVGIGLLLTQTRSTTLAAAVVLVLAARALPGRSEVVRVRAQALVATVLVGLVPLVVVAGLSDRFGGQEQSDTLHVVTVQRGIESLLADPLGGGLALAARDIAGDELAGLTHSENQYLNIGNQVGLLGMVLYIALLVSIVRTLHRRAQAVRDGAECFPLLGARAAIIAFMITGMFLSPFGNIFAGWLCMGVAGASLGAGDRRAAWSGTERDHVPPAPA